MNRKTNKPPIAALSLEIKSGQREQLLIPDGDFRSSDGSGRPSEVPAWRMSALVADRVLSRAKSRSAKIVVDYEHQTLRAAENGKPAPASGRIDRQSLRYESGLGILGAIEWTKRAQEMIDAGEYAYLSPVFPYDDQTGDVLGLMHFALTNDPGMDGLTVAALSAFSDFLNEEEPHMTLLQKLLASLGLADNTNEDVALTAVAALKAQASEVAGLKTNVATLSAQVGAPDPAKFVPIATLSALQGEHADLQGKLAALTAEVSGGKLEKIVADGLAAGKLTPATEGWARDLGKKDVAALSAFIAAAPVVVTPGETQSGGQAAAGDLDLNDASAVALSAQLYQAEMSGKGINITTVQAVAHVSKKGA